jgi:hypothetical protein
MVKSLRTSVLLAVVLVLAAPSISSAKRKPPPPPPPPPDSAGDCSFAAEASVPDYLVLASISIGVRCATPKQTISVSAQLTRDGVLLSPVLPLGSESRTCSNATECFVGYDLFSLDNLPEPTPGDQVYCASGSGLVGGTVLGPGTACEGDARI